MVKKYFYILYEPYEYRTVSSMLCMCWMNMYILYRYMSIRCGFGFGATQTLQTFNAMLLLFILFVLLFICLHFTIWHNIQWKLLYYCLLLLFSFIHDFLHSYVYVYWRCSDQNTTRWLIKKNAIKNLKMINTRR